MPFFIISKNLDNSIFKLSITMPPFTLYLCKKKHKEMRIYPLLNKRKKMKNFITDFTVIMQKPILTAQEAALYLGWSVSHLYKKTMRREIPFYKPEGKTLYFDRVELESWMRRNRVKTTEEAQHEADEYLNTNRKGGKK